MTSWGDMDDNNALAKFAADLKLDNFPYTRFLADAGCNTRKRRRA